MLKLEGFNTAAKLVGKRQALLDFLHNCKDARSIHVSVPRKDPSSLSLVDSGVAVVDPDSVGIILEMAESDARRQLKDIEEKIIGIGLELSS